MLRWTSNDLLNAVRQYCPQINWSGIEASVDVRITLAAITERLGPVPLSMILNFHVEAGDGTLDYLCVGGDDPGDADDECTMTCRVITGRIGQQFGIFPFYPGGPVPEQAWNVQIEATMARIPDYPVSHGVIMPVYVPKELTMSALAFFDDGKGGEFVRYFHPARLPAHHTGPFFKDAWRNMRAKSFSPPRIQI